VRSELLKRLDLGNRVGNFAHLARTNHFAAIVYNRVDSIEVMRHAIALNGSFSVLSNVAADRDPW